MLKLEARVVGFDDGPFRFGDAAVPLVGIVARGPTYVEGVLRTDVTVDGDDATDRLLDVLRKSRYTAEIRLVLTDGVTFAGFNLLDLERVAHDLDVPVLAVSRGAPDLDAAEAAIRRRFADDADRRVALLRRHPVRLVRTEGQPIAVRSVGLADDDVPLVLEALTVRGLVPEPLRLAHLVATAIVRGASRGQ